MVKSLLSFIIILLFAGSIYTQTATPPSGSGTLGDPYQIISMENLDWIRSEVNGFSHNMFAGKYFIQTIDIDAAYTATWDGNKGFYPIGNSSYPFRGNYDGQNHAISNLTINRSAYSSVALFSYASDGTIANLSLVNVNITGSSSVASLISSSYGTVTNCFSSGSVTSVAGSAAGLISSHSNNTVISGCHSAVSVTSNGGIAGGLIGSFSDGTVSNCHYEGTVNASGGIGYAGGLIAYASYGGNITNCSSKGTISAPTYSYVGGLCGWSTSNTTYSYSTCNVTGNQNVGGLAGYIISGGNLTNCYALGAVNGSSNVGGLVGDMEWGRTLTNCYAAGAVSATSNFGGLLGYAPGDIISCYRNTDVNPTGNTYGTGATTAQMKTSGTYSGWDFTTVWQMFGSNYPDLISNPNDGLLPIELTSFTADAADKGIKLKWQTATEVNNYGFDVERSLVTSQQSLAKWEKVGFVAGSGNSNSPKEYSFVDAYPLPGKSQYRLKQIDINGNFKYYSTVTGVNYNLTDVNEKQLPKEFALSQNYPNPFNPATTIEYSIPENPLLRGVGGVLVSLKVYDILGNEVATLVNENKQPGYYQVSFNANNLSTGVYIYRLNAGSFTSTKKLMLMK